MVSALRLASRYRRDRNVVDHQLEKLLGVFQLVGKRFAIGDVIEQRDQEFGLVLFVARDHAVGGENALLRTALDNEFVAELAFGRIERGLVRLFYARRGRGAEDLVGAFADDTVAGEAREAFERAVGKDVAAVLDALGGHTYRHIVEHRFQELLGRCELSGKLALLATILVRRHRTAVWQRKIFDQNRPPAGQFGNEAFRGAGVCIEIRDADVEDSALAPQLQQFRPGHVSGNIRTRQAVDFEVAVVAEHDPLPRIRHHHAMAQVVQGGADKRISA
jgi:hypothetical protein